MLKMPNSFQMELCSELMGRRRMGFLLLRKKKKKTRKLDQVGYPGLPSPHSRKSRPPWVFYNHFKPHKAEIKAFRSKVRGREERKKEGGEGERGCAYQNTLFSLFTLALS